MADSENDPQPKVVLLDYPNTKDIIEGEQIANPSARASLNLGFCLFIVLAGMLAVWNGAKVGEPWALAALTAIAWTGLVLSVGATIFGVIGAMHAGKPNVEGAGMAGFGLMLGVLGLIFLLAYWSPISEMKKQPPPYRPPPRLYIR